MDKRTHPLLTHIEYGLCTATKESREVYRKDGGKRKEAKKTRKPIWNSRLDKKCYPNHTLIWFKKKFPAHTHTYILSPYICYGIICNDLLANLVYCHRQARRLQGFDEFPKKNFNMHMKYFHNCILSAFSELCF